MLLALVWRGLSSSRLGARGRGLESPRHTGEGIRVGLREREHPPARVALFECVEPLPQVVGSRAADALQQQFVAALPRSFSPDLYNHMWGRAEFTATGTLKDYDGTPLLARLDGRRTLFLAGDQDEAMPAPVAAFAARAEGVPPMVAITSTLRSTRSAAKAGRRSKRLPAQRNSIAIFFPST